MAASTTTTTIAAKSDTYTSFPKSNEIERNNATTYVSTDYSYNRSEIATKVC